MNPDSPQTPREQMEARITAMLLDELSAEEASALRIALEQDPALSELHDRLKSTIELVKEAAATPTAETAAQPAPLKLSDARRQQLLQHFKTVAPAEFNQPSRRQMPWFIPMSIAAVLVALLSAAALLPGFSKRLERPMAALMPGRRYSEVNVQHATEHGEPSLIANGRITALSEEEASESRLAKEGQTGSPPRSDSKRFVGSYALAIPPESSAPSTGTVPQKDADIKSSPKTEFESINLAGAASKPSAVGGVPPSISSISDQTIVAGPPAKPATITIVLPSANGLVGGTVTTLSGRSSETASAGRLGGGELGGGGGGLGGGVGISGTGSGFAYSRNEPSGRGGISRNDGELSKLADQDSKAEGWGTPAQALALGNTDNFSSSTLGRVNDPGKEILARSRALATDSDRFSRSSEAHPGSVRFRQITPSDTLPGAMPTKEFEQDFSSRLAALDNGASRRGGARLAVPESGPSSDKANKAPQLGEDRVTLLLSDAEQQIAPVTAPALPPPAEAKQLSTSLALGFAGARELGREEAGKPVTVDGGDSLSLASSAPTERFLTKTVQQLKETEALNVEEHKPTPNSKPGSAPVLGDDAALGSLFATIPNTFDIAQNAAPQSAQPAGASLAKGFVELKSVPATQSPPPPSQMSMQWPEAGSKLAGTDAGIVAGGAKPPQTEFSLDLARTTPNGTKDLDALNNRPKIIAIDADGTLPESSLLENRGELRRKSEIDKLSANGTVTFGDGSVMGQAQNTPALGLTSLETSKPSEVTNSLRGFYDDNYAGKTEAVEQLRQNFRIQGGNGQPDQNSAQDFGAIRSYAIQVPQAQSAAGNTLGRPLTSMLPVPYLDSQKQTWSYKAPDSAQGPAPTDELASERRVDPKLMERYGLMRPGSGPVAELKKNLDSSDSKKISERLESVADQPLFVNPSNVPLAPQPMQRFGLSPAGPKASETVVEEEARRSLRQPIVLPQVPAEPQKELADFMAKDAPKPLGQRIATSELVQDGRRLNESGRFDESEAKLKKAATLDPSNVTTHYYSEYIREARTGAESRRRELATGKDGKVEQTWNLPVQDVAKEEKASSVAEEIRPFGDRQSIASAPPQQTSQVWNEEHSVSAARTNVPSTALQEKARELDGLVRSKEQIAQRLTSEIGGTFTATVDAALPTSNVKIVDRAEAEAEKSPTLWGRLRGVMAGNVERTARIEVAKDTNDLAPLLMGGLNQPSYDPYFTTTEVEQIKSKAVLSRVIEDLKLYESWAKKQGAGQKLNDEEIYNHLLKTVDVRPVPNSGQMEIRVKSDKPDEAARIANAIAEAYRDIYRLKKRAQASVNSTAILNKQLTDQESKIALAKQELERLQKESNIQQLDISPPKPAAAGAPVPQPEVQTRDNAFSTFSLNVSDVSFKLAAASLEKNVMPEAATVRSEEFINAFDYRDSEPPPGVPVAFAWERARYPFAHNSDLLRLSVKTAAQGRQPGRPMNLVLLLDNSGSMERADRTRIVREALRVLATQLQAQDKISVIAFSRTARLWVDGAPGNQASQVAEQAANLTPAGGTNLEDAMNLAYQTALRHYVGGGVNRVVLLTDGAANLGNVNPDALKQKVETHRKQGVALDCFGIGWEGLNDDLLEVLSRNGDGRYGFINTPEEAATEFAGQLAGALRVAASDVKVQVEFNPKRVTAYRQIGYAKHQLTKQQFRDNTVDAAEIGAAESGNALYAVEVNPRGEGPLAIVRVRFKTPGTAEYREHEWPVPFSGNAVALEQSGPTMRLAAAASAFSEWLVSSPYAGEVTPDRLLAYLGGVPDVYGADTRPKKLEWMIRQAKNLSGK